MVVNHGQTFFFPSFRVCLSRSHVPCSLKRRYIHSAEDVSKIEKWYLNAALFFSLSSVLSLVLYTRLVQHQNQCAPLQRALLFFADSSELQRVYTGTFKYVRNSLRLFKLHFQTNYAYKTGKKETTPECRLYTYVHAHHRSQRTRFNIPKYTI